MPEAGHSEVILVHGLWYGRTSTALLKRRLQRAGFTVSTFTYSSIFRAPVDTASRLAQWLEERAGKTHLVGHSLGGLVILQALALSNTPFTGRVVMLGTPLNGSKVARRISSWPLIGKLLGSSSDLLQQGLEPESDSVEIGMIAGRTNIGLGRITGAIDGPGDGTVLISETRHPSLAAHVEIAAGHTGLLYSAEAARLVTGFLQSGRMIPA